MDTEQRHRRKNGQEGMTMLLALIVIAAVTAAGIGAAVLVVTEFNSRVASDEGIKAYYAADAGMERALFTIFNNRLAGSLLGTTCRQISLPYSGMQVCSQVLNNFPIMEPLIGDAEVSLEKTSLYDANTVVTIARNQTVEYNYALTTETAPPRSIVVSAPDIGIPAVCAEEETEAEAINCMGGVSGIQITWSYLLRSEQGGTIQDIAPANSTVRIFSLLNVRNGVLIDLFTGTPTSMDAASLTLQNPAGVTEIPADINFSNISGWVIRVTALTTTIPNFTLTPCTGQDDCTVNTSEIYSKSNSISVMSRGTAGGAAVTLNATVPWVMPASGIFDYAIFSEESLDAD